MPIDWNLAHVDWAQVPNLGDILLKRDQYQRGLLQNQQLQAGVQEHADRQAAKARVIAGIQAEQQQAPQVGPSPQVAPQSQTPAVQLPSPQLGGQIGAAIGASMAGPQAPQIPPGMPLVKPPDDHPQPGVTIAPSIDGNPAKKAQKDQLLSASDPGDFNQRVKSVFGQRKMIPDYLKIPGAMDLVDPEVIHADLQKQDLEESHRYDQTVRNVAYQGGQEAKNLRARAAATKDEAESKNLIAKAKVLEWNYQNRQTPEDIRSQKQEDRMAQIDAQGGYRLLAGGQSSDSRETVAGITDAGKTARTRLALDSRSALQTAMIKFQTDRENVRQQGLTQVEQDRQLQEGRRELMRQYSIHGKNMDPEQLANLEPILQGLGVPVVKSTPGTFYGTNETKGIGPAPEVPTRQAPQMSAPAVPVPAGQESQFEKDARDNPGGAKLASFAPTPAGKPAPKVSGARGLSVPANSKLPVAPTVKNTGSSQAGEPTNTQHVGDQNKDEAKAEKKRKRDALDKSIADIQKRLSQ